MDGPIDHCGECEAQDIWRENDDLNEEPRPPGLVTITNSETLLALYPMKTSAWYSGISPCPSRASADLPRCLQPVIIKARSWTPNYYVDVSEKLIKRQLNRVFLDYPEQCRVIGASRPALRQEALRHADFICRVNKDAYLQG